MERNEGDHFDKPAEADYTGHSEKQIDIALENGVGEATNKKQTQAPVQQSDKKKVVTVFDAKDAE